MLRYLNQAKRAEVERDHRSGPAPVGDCPNWAAVFLISAVGDSPKPGTHGRGFRFITRPFKQIKREVFKFELSRDN